MAAPMTPPAAAAGFLSAAGWAGATILPLAGDASFRRYFRAVLPGRSAVLMDAPPTHEDSRPFLAVAGQLHALGFRAPAILAQDLGEGLVLIEDFGDVRMAEAIAADPARERPIYEAAVDLLAALHRHPASALPPYDMAVYRREAALLPEWYMPAVGLGPGPGYAEAWAEALAPIAGDHAAIVLRDYHAENIMLLGEGGLGLLDFQDALAGHPAYDLVSLLQDARRDVSEELEAAMLGRYGDVDPAAYALLGAQRNAKIVGIFARLWRRDGKPRYMTYQPRVWRYLERDLAHPALAPVRAWFDANIPVAKRGVRWEGFEPTAELALRPKPAAAIAPIKVAMVLAAGLGQRMLPLTETRPKPLIEVAGKPLIDHALDRLRAAGVRRVVVNAHYLADDLERHLKSRDQEIELLISDERDALLETGGGMVKALPLIDVDRFLVVNSDNLWVDGPVDALRLLAAGWDEAAMDALLLMVPLARANCHRGIGDFHMDPAGRLERRRPGKVAPFVFTGVQIVSRRLFADAPGGAFSTNLLWNRAIEQGRLYGMVHQGLWFDVGTPPAIGETEAVLAGR